MRELKRTTSFKRTVVRIAGAAVLGLALVGCQAADELGYGPKHLREVSAATREKMSELGMSETSPVLMRIFKEESKFEVWKKDRTGRYALLKSYDICKWSGNLGPKIKEGDRQAPEGYYTITPGLMNPNSQYHLAFNTGFPNAYDRANARTGTALMVHGACSSRGCYAMTDAQIQEIYALARDAFRGGQRSFQLQAYPFRMTAENMGRHWKSPHMGFWKMLKEGYDTFELTRQEPKVDVCGRQYVFNAGTKEPLSPVDACPALEQPADLLMALRKKATEDEQKAIVVAARLETEEKANDEHKLMLAQRTEQLRVAELERQQKAATGAGDGLIASVWGADSTATTASLPAAAGDGTALAMAPAEAGQSRGSRSMFTRLFSFGDETPVLPAPTAATAVAAPTAGSEAATASVTTTVPALPAAPVAGTTASAQKSDPVALPPPEVQSASAPEAPVVERHDGEDTGWWPLRGLF